VPAICVKHPKMPLCIRMAIFHVEPLVPNKPEHYSHIVYLECPLYAGAMGERRPTPWLCRFCGPFHYCEPSANRGLSPVVAPLQCNTVEQKSIFGLQPGPEYYWAQGVPHID
jgi:hypothetical protein